MTREEIENASSDAMPTFGSHADPYEAGMMRDQAFNSFIIGAEWMLKQTNERVKEVLKEELDANECLNEIWVDNLIEVVQSNLRIQE